MWLDILNSTVQDINQKWSENGRCLITISGSEITTVRLICYEAIKNSEWLFVTVALAAILIALNGNSTNTCSNSDQLAKSYRLVS